MKKIEIKFQIFCMMHTLLSMLRDGTLSPERAESIFFKPVIVNKFKKIINKNEFNVVYNGMFYSDLKEISGYEKFETNINKDLNYIKKYLNKLISEIKSEDLIK